MSTQQDITIPDLDEALMYAALTARRGQGWVDWVDQLLDARNLLANGQGFDQRGQQ